MPGSAPQYSMDIQVHGKQIDIGDALRQHVVDRLSDGVTKYFESALDANITLSREAHLIRVDCSVHVGHDIRLQSHGEAPDPYAAFDMALERIEKRVRRYKRRLTDHHQRQRENFESQQATAYVLASEDDESVEEPTSDQPIIVAEMETEIPTITVGDAVMRMDLAESPVFMFRNSAHGGLNVVYRRTDGNVGWIDPASSV